MARGTKKTDAGEATSESGVTLPEMTGNADLSTTDLAGTADTVTDVTETSTDTGKATTTGDDVMVQPTRYFTDSATGEFRTPSDEPFSVNRRRMAELYENGLVREVKPQPDNKMRPDPQTKE